MLFALLALTLLPHATHGQSALRPTPENTTDLPPLFIEEHATGDTVTLELQHAGLTYAPDDQFTLFGTEGSPLDPREQQLTLACTTVADCASEPASESDSSTLPVPATESTARLSYRWPVRFHIARPLQPQRYLLEVRNPEHAVKHYRRVRVVPDAPFVDRVTVQQNGIETDDENTLHVDPTQPLDVTLTLTGGPFYNGTRVLLQDRRLVERRRSRNELVLDLTLDAEDAAQLELGVWPLQFSHPLAASANGDNWNAVLATVSLQRTEPPLLEDPQPVYVVGADPGRITQDVQVSGFHFSPQAQLCTERGPLVTARCSGITRQQDRTLTAPVVLDLPDDFDGGVFRVYVRNGDGQESDRKPVRVLPQNVAASVSEVSPDEPVVEGVPTEVVFRREAASAFPASGPFTLEVNGQTQRLTPIQPPTADELRTRVTLPDGTGGRTPVFVLSAGGNSWAGEFDTVVSRPRLITDAPALRRGLATRLTFAPPTDDAHLLARTTGLEIEGSALVDGEARLRATNDLVGEQADVWIRVKSRVVDSLRIPVAPWPDPTDVLAWEHDDQRLPIDSMETLTLPEGTPLRLHPGEAFVGRDAPPKVTVQLRDDNGRALRDPVSVRFDQATPTVLYPSTWGLSGGDPFTIEFRTPDGRTLHRSGYVRRPLIQQFVVSGGLTAVEYSFGTQTDGRQGNTLSGVNLGLHWTPEWFAPAASRPVGFGVHTVASETDNRVRMRLAASVLLFEKLAIGLSGGPGGGALFVGANASFLDLSKLFSGRRGR